MSDHPDRRRFLGLSMAALASSVLIPSCASPLAGPQATGTSVATDNSTQRVTVSVVSAAMQVAKGGDGLFHDAFVPSFFVLETGRPTYLTIVNFSQNRHTFVSSSLNLAFDVKPGGRGSNGEPAPSRVTQLLGVTKPGVYTWTCTIECDGHNGHWAMAPGSDQLPGVYQGVFGFMGGTITVV